MKRLQNPTTTLFLVNIHQVYVNDNGAENNFPLDRYEGYLDFDADFDKKLKEFNELELTSDDVDCADGVEKVLSCVTVPTDFYNKYKDHEEFYEYVVGECDYNFTEIKSFYCCWSDILEHKKQTIIDKFTKNGTVSSELSEKIKEEVEDYFLDDKGVDVYDFFNEISKKYFIPIDPTYGEKEENKKLDFLMELSESFGVEF